MVDRTGRVEQRVHPGCQDRQGIAIRTDHGLYRLARHEVRVIGEGGIQRLLDRVSQGRWCDIQSWRRR